MVRKTSFGIGLLELMLVLAIIAALLLMATRYSTEAREDAKVMSASKTVHDIVDASFKWIAGESNFQDISIDALIRAGFLSPQPVNCQSGGGQCIQDPWGGTISVKPAGDETRQIEVTVPGAPIAACKRLNDILQHQGVILQNQNCNGGYIGLYPQR